MPGSACRRSSVSPPTETRSTTSSTVKPRTFFPPPTSRSTVVPPPSPSAEGSGCRNARHPSTTVTRVPRTLTTPATTGGAPGIRVGSSRGRISRTRSASAAQTRRPTRNKSSRTTPASLIRSEEAKILQGVALSKQIRIGGRFSKRRNEIGGPFGAQVEPRAAHGMGEREPGRMQQLPRRERLEALGRLPLGRRDAPAAAEGVLPIAHDRVSHVRQMHADLVGAPGAERHTQQVGLREPRGHPHMRYRVAPPREHRLALAIRGMARDRRLDVHGALRKVAPGERVYAALAWGHFAKSPVDIEAPITRHPTDRKRMTVLAGGRHAVTHVRVTARFAQTDLLRVTLGTGRTHQIRVHLAHVGHPVVGDREYAFGGSRRVTPSERQTAERLEALAPRQLLHAARLAFAHPVSGARLDLRSEWPADLVPALREAAADPNLLAQRNPLQYLGFFASDE